LRGIPDLKLSEFSNIYVSIDDVRVAVPTVLNVQFTIKSLMESQTFLVLTFEKRFAIYTKNYVCEYTLNEIT
jgi:hypothetical protein